MVAPFFQRFCCRNGWQLRHCWQRNYPSQICRRALDQNSCCLRGKSITDIYLRMLSSMFHGFSWMINLYWLDREVAKHPFGISGKGEHGSQIWKGKFNQYNVHIKIQCLLQAVWVESFTLVPPKREKLFFKYPHTQKTVMKLNGIRVQKKFLHQEVEMGSSKCGTIPSKSLTYPQLKLMMLKYYLLTSTNMNSKL